MKSDVLVFKLKFIMEYYGIYRKNDKLKVCLTTYNPSVNMDFLFRNFHF